MNNEKIPVIYEDNNLLAINKPAGITVFPEEKIESSNTTLIDAILKEHPEIKNVGEGPRYGIVHRLDKDTSGVLLIAKNKLALNFFQEQFKKRLVKKEYLALVIGEIKENSGVIKTLIGRSKKDRRRQKAYSYCEPAVKNANFREAITFYRVAQTFQGYTLLKVAPKTGRKHQIRCHLAYINHPIVNDRLYGSKNQPELKNLKRQFLHAYYLKIKLPTGIEKEFEAEMPENLKKAISLLHNK